MKYNTLIKNIKKRKLWDVIIYSERADNHTNKFYYWVDFENFIKAKYHCKESKIDFKLTYIRERKELFIIGTIPLF